MYQVPERFVKPGAVLGSRLSPIFEFDVLKNLRDLRDDGTCRLNRLCYIHGKAIPGLPPGDGSAFGGSTNR